MAAPVFLSYSSHDEPRALALVDALERRGIGCWISCRDIQGGANYADAIAEVIPSAPALVLVFSQNADRSDEIKKEVQLAGECKVLVVPFFIEKVRPSRAFAYELKTRQQIDAYTDWNAGIERLLRSLAGTGHVAVLAADAKPGGASPGAVSNSILGPRYRRAAVGIVALSVAGAAVGLARTRWIEPRPSPGFEATSQQNAPGAARTIAAALPPAAPKPPEPTWVALPTGANFLNARAEDVKIYEAPNTSSKVPATIIPGGTLFLDGDPVPISSATVGKETWLRFKTKQGDAYALRDSLCSIDSPNCATAEAAASGKRKD